MQNAIDIDKILFDLLQFRRSRPEETAQFNTLRHNDNLCPAVQNQVEAVSESFKKYKNITYDVQGILDHGTDVFFKETIDDKNYFICFQIKAQVDLDGDDYLSKLKAQRYESSLQYLETINYYILICCDIYDTRPTDGLQTIDLAETKRRNSIAKKNKSKIRNISASMGNDKNTTIIEPQYVKTFLNLPITQIDAITKSKFGEADKVFLKAYSLVNTLLPNEIALIGFFINEAVFNDKKYLDLSDILQSAYLNTIYDGIPDYDRNNFFNADKIKDIHQMSFNELKDEFIEFGLIFKGLRKDEMIKFLTDNYFDIYCNQHRDFDERIEEDINYLMDNFIYFRDDKYSVNLDEVYSLAIFLLDANIRYEYSNTELLKYMVDLFNFNKIKFTF